MSTETTMKEELKEVLLDHEEPLGKKIPGAPFAIVALTYLTILIASLCVVGLITWFVS